MFITNELTPEEMFSQIIGLHGALGYRANDTERLIDIGHNPDLCPAFQERLDIMLGAYKRHRADAQDLQSVRDSGVDVLVSYVDRDGADRRFGLQIKSNTEFDDWAAKKHRSFVRDLKAQILEAKHDARLDFLYVVLCAAEPAHRDRIRTVRSELKNVSDQLVVGPRAALALLEMSDADIVGFVGRTLCEGDWLMREVGEEIDAFGPQASYFALRLMDLAIREDQRRIDDDGVFFEWESDWAEIREPKAPELELHDVVQALEGVGLRTSEEGRLVEISAFPPALFAAYVDARARHGQADLETLVALFEIGSSRRRLPSGGSGRGRRGRKRARRRPLG